MTPDEMETAAASFSERVQVVGTGPALDEIRDAVRAQAFEEIAKRFEAEFDPNTARLVRMWRWVR